MVKPLRFYLIFYSFLCASILVISPLSSQNADSLWQEGEWAFQADDMPMALSYFQECAATDTTRMDCIMGVATTARQLGMALVAKEAFLTLAQDSVFQVDAWRRLAPMFEGQDNLPKAVKYYTLLNKADTTNALYFRKLGQLYQRAGERMGAFTNYSHALKLNDQDLYALKGLADILLNNKQNIMADSLLNIALRLDSTNISIKLMYARSKYQQKQYDSTTLVLEPLTREVGLTNYFSKMLGYSFLKIDSVQQSIHYLQQSLDRESDPEYAEYYLGIAHEKLEDYETAAYFYNRAAVSGVSPNEGVYYKLLGNLARKQGQTKDAIRYYNKALDFSEDGVVSFYLGDLCNEYYKDKSMAIRHFERYLKSDHSDAAYRKYARKKITYLKQLVHMSK